MFMLPWLGGNPKRVLTKGSIVPGWQGRSNRTGFKVSQVGNKQQYSTDGYGDQDSSNTVFYIYGCLLVVAIVTVFLWEVVDVLIFDNQFLEPTRWAGRTMFLIGIWLILSDLAYHISVWKSSLHKYHEAEHKIVCMLIEGVDLTAENFSRTPCVLYGCGTGQRVTSAMLWGIFGFFLSIDNILVVTIMGGIITYSVLRGTMAYLVQMMLTSLGKLASVKSTTIIAIQRIVGMYLFEMPTAIISLVLVLPLVFERLVALSQPGEEIMLEGLALAQRIQNSKEAPC